jgi:hypothetical protein
MLLKGIGGDFNIFFKKMNYLSSLGMDIVVVTSETK